MNRALLSFIILSGSLTMSIVDHSSRYTYAMTMPTDQHREPAQYQLASVQYLAIATERLKNIEEILIRLSESLENGDLVPAKIDYIKAHYQYESIRPLILTFPNNIDAVINVHPYELPDDVNDLNFIGFHAIEYHLFRTEDTAQSFVETQKLLAKVRTLIEFMEIQEIPLTTLLEFPQKFIQQIINNKLPGSNNIYSGADLGEIAANIEGIHIIVNQLIHILPPQFVSDFTQQERKIENILDAYKSGDIYQAHEFLEIQDKILLLNEVEILEQLLSDMNDIIRKQLKTHKDQLYKA